MPRAKEPQSRPWRCSATTRDGRPCRQNPLLGSDPPLCLIHAGLTRPYEVPPERRCTATNRAGSQCGRWAERDSDPPLCHVHAGQSRLQQAPAERRCTATTRDGGQCSLWAVRDSDPPRCCVHAGLTTPGPERRCTATTRAGDPCDHPAVAGTDPPLCHFHSGRHWPPPDDGRCTARLPNGHRCPNWAARDEDPPLCATHSGRTGFEPGHRHTMRHGYYMSPPPLGEAEWAAVELARASGRELQGEIVLRRLLIRMILAYVTRSELPLGQNLNSARLIIRNVRALARLLLARRELEGPLESRERDKRQMQNIVQELATRRRPAEEEAPPQEGTVSPQELGGSREGLAGLEKEALLLLAGAGNSKLTRDIGVVRIMLRRVLGYVTNAQGLSVAERIRLLDFLLMGADSVIYLLRDDMSLRPTQKEMTQAAINQALDALGEKWGLDL